MKVARSELIPPAAITILAIIGVLSSQFFFKNPPVIGGFTFWCAMTTLVGLVACFFAMRGNKVWGRIMTSLALIVGFAGVLSVDTYEYGGTGIAMMLAAFLPIFYRGDRTKYSIIALIAIGIAYLIIGYSQYSHISQPASHAPVDFLFRYWVPCWIIPFGIYRVEQEK